VNYRTGDKVRFLNDVGGGVISRIVDAGRVYVKDEDDFEIPVNVADIVVVGRETATVTTDDNLSRGFVGNTGIDRNSDDYELLLAVVPENQSVPAGASDMALYFINDSAFYCMYAVAQYVGKNEVQLLHSGEITPDTKEYLCTLNWSKQKNKTDLCLTWFLYKQGDYRLYPPEQTKIELNPAKLIKGASFTENDFFLENACILTVAAFKKPETELEINPAELEKAIKQKKDKVLPPPVVKPATPEVEEVDLHIEELVDSTKGMDNGQMLELQKARFITALELGMVAGTRRMVFIHGVGNGRLKHEIRRLLDTQYSDRVRYQDASFREYGYGATLVEIKHNIRH
jgi:hypothetical protein